MNQLKYIQFRISTDYAKQIWKKYHSKSLFNKQPSLENIKKAYLPFYTCSATIHSYIIVQLRNPEGQKAHVLRHKWNGIENGDKGMQVYASENFQRRFIDQLKGKIFNEMNVINLAHPTQS